MIPITAFYDHRHREIRVGDLVAYPGPVHLEGKGETGEGVMVVRSKVGLLRHSKVKSIMGDDFGGFGDAGRNITITLEDGHVQKGDGEHGGWNFLKLED